MNTYLFDFIWYLSSHTIRMYILLFVLVLTGFTTTDPSPLPGACNACDCSALGGKYFFLYSVLTHYHNVLCTCLIMISLRYKTQFMFCKHIKFFTVDYSTLLLKIISANNIYYTQPNYVNNIITNTFSYYSKWVTNYKYKFKLKTRVYLLILLCFFKFPYIILFEIEVLYNILLLFIYSWTHVL